MAPATSSRTLTVLAAAGIGALAYAVYFDYKRRTDAGFRKRLRKEKKKLDKSVAEEATSVPTSGNPLGDASVPTAEIIAAMKSIKDDQVPTTPEEREKYFMAQVEKGEALCAQGPDFAIEAALAFFRALRVYPSPVELIMIFQNTVPEPIFKMVLEMMRLDVSDPPPSADVDTLPHASISEDEESTSKRGPPSEASSQDWDRGLNVLVAATVVVASHGSNIHPFLFHMFVYGQVKGRVEGYYEVFPPKHMSVSTKTVEITDPSGATALKRILVADRDFTTGETIYKERPIVSVLDSDLEGKGSHCSQCLRQIDDGAALRPDGDRLTSAFCSKECEVKLKAESQSLLFGPEYAIPIELNPNEDPEYSKKREDAQIAFARFVHESGGGRTRVTLVARFIARQVVNETVKLLPTGHPSVPTETDEWTGHGYTLFDHVERVRFLELNADEDEAEQLRAILKANLLGLEDFVTNERYTVLIGKMAYNAYGISFAGGRDGKPPPSVRPEDVELTRTPNGTARQVGAGFFAVSSYISHSCDPSARPTFENGDSEMHLVATRDVKAGDEITARYRRRKELARGWRFACQCDRCVKEAPPPSAGEKEPQLNDESKVEPIVSQVDREGALGQSPPAVSDTTTID
ncbi:MAS20-domain-containing protein [Lactarius hatsudake]|nr:MAS20-domain-containing protein [Lactarius hatsudake]